MSLSVIQKQNYLYLGMVILTIAIAIISYRAFEKKWLYYREAENKFNEKKFKEAIELYKQSLALGPVSSNALLHLADAYVATGDFSKAIEWYRIYLQLHPDDSNARLSLARTLGWVGDIEASRQEYNQLLQKNEMDQTP